MSVSNHVTSKSRTQLELAEPFTNMLIEDNSYSITESNNAA
jgi:hypothetical protein